MVKSLFFVLLLPCFLFAVPIVVDPCDDAKGWKNVAVDTEVKAVGKASLRWEHGKAGDATFSAAPRDWTAGNAIRFRLHSEKASKNTIVLLLYSENPKTEGADYWHRKIPLDFVGWREIVIPRRSMVAARRPLGWDKINLFRFSASGWEQTLDPSIVVRLDQMELIDQPLPPSPRTTDADLFAALNLELPELGEVKAAVAADDLELATAKLAAYYRERRSVPWYYDPHTIDRTINYSRQGAEETVAGKIKVINIWHEFPQGKIDWSYNATFARPDLPDNREWLWQLGRMGFWGNLGRAYWATGDERYAQTFVRHLRSWARNCPHPERPDNGARSNWRTIECGIRMLGSWPEAWHRFLHSPSFTDQDVALFLKVCLEHAQFLERFHSRGNWLTMEMAGLYTVGVLFPEFRKADAWRSQAGTALYKELDAQFLPDGAQIELTTGYHQVALNCVMKIPRLAQVVGRFDELPGDYISKAEEAYAFNLKMMTPDRDLPHVNDAWHTNVPGSLGSVLKLFPQRRDFLWIAKDGKEGEAPDFASLLLPYAGFAVMRSDWGREANYLAFDGGLLGYAHVHQDKLSLVLHAFGREIIYDGGGGSYESSKWRSYATNSFSHNTATVDGLPQARDRGDRENNISWTPLPIVWKSTEQFDYAASIYEKGYGKKENLPASHERRVLFLKPDLFVVADCFRPNDGAAHTYENRWHLDSVKTDFRDDMLTTMDEGKPNLVVVPLLREKLEVFADSAVEDPEILGWKVNKNSGRTAVTTIRQRISGGGLQQQLTLFIPLRAGEGNPVVAQREGEVEFADGRKLRVSILEDGLEVLEFNADGSQKRFVTVAK